MARVTDIRLNDTKAVCRLLARTINGMLKGIDHQDYIDTNTGRAVIYGANVLLSALQASDIESRLEQLEKQVLDRKGGWSA